MNHPDNIDTVEEVMDYLTENTFSKDDIDFSLEEYNPIREIEINGSNLVLFGEVHGSMMSQIAVEKIIENNEFDKILVELGEPRLLNNYYKIKNSDMTVDRKRLETKINQIETNIKTNYSTINSSLILLLLQSNKSVLSGAIEFSVLHSVREDKLVKCIDEVNEAERVTNMSFITRLLSFAVLNIVGTSFVEGNNLVAPNKQNEITYLDYYFGGDLLLNTPIDQHDKPYSKILQDKSLEKKVENVSKDTSLFNRVIEYLDNVCENSYEFVKEINKENDTENNKNLTFRETILLENIIDSTRQQNSENTLVVLGSKHIHPLYSELNKK